MPSQESLIQIKGTTGNMTFSKTADGYRAQKKSNGLSAEKIKNSSTCERIRENGAEFGRAGRAGRLLRQTFRALALKASDRRMVPRMTQQMTRVVKSDPTNARGMRNAVDGEIGLLQGFQFNINCNLTEIFFAPITATVDRTSGQTEIEVLPFVPAEMVKMPVGTTHFKLKSGAAAIDFTAEECSSSSKSSDFIKWNNTATAVITLANSVPPNTVHPIFILFGIEFYQEVNGLFYPLQSTAFNALGIIKVDSQ